ncbi:MAG: tRNA (N6-threonylcarbamoyladenosine(37)-N6)-methyltransferase TrmO, partial [Syntrophomonadaceae bacterium]|nr:tRNA (N6-threonylcarbamoyladenosine(37)-N6)-methyltransferase TrmO [Syntrophomonadaceae bacterium]
KPYYENDIVFSPDTPYIKGKNREIRQGIMRKQAFTHHREDCPELYIAVRMAIIAEEELGKLNSVELKVAVSGPSCLGDCIQGITRSRLAHPVRFAFEHDDNQCRTVWSRAGQSLSITLKNHPELEHIKNCLDEQLFEIKKN